MLYMPGIHQVNCLFYNTGGAAGSNVPNEDVAIGDIIKRALQNNPRILYSPNGTDADNIIQAVGVL